MSADPQCLAAIRFCRVRVTRLDAVGNPVAGPKNSYVTANGMMLTVNPQIEAGPDRTLRSGCDCTIAQYKGDDSLKYFTLELDLGKVEPGIMEMMLGADVVLDADSNPIGWWWPQQNSCDGSPQPNVCLEGWQDLWEDDHQAATPHRYFHWTWPSSRWQIGAHTLQNDFMQPKLSGFTRGNPNWGLGIYGDQIEAVGSLGGPVFSDVLPSAACGYLDQPIS